MKKVFSLSTKDKIQAIYKKRVTSTKIDIKYHDWCITEQIGIA